MSESVNRERVNSNGGWERESGSEAATNVCSDLEVDEQKRDSEMERQTVKETLKETVRETVGEIERQTNIRRWFEKFSS